MGEPSVGWKWAGWAAAAVWGLRALRPDPRAVFRDKVVAVTGGSRGLGLLLAEEAARRGASVSICARDAAAVERARRRLVELGARVYAAPCDLTDDAALLAWLEETKQHLGAVDVLINNAGVIQVGPFEEMTLADFEEAMQIHLFAPLKAIWAVLSDMRARGDGRIVNISSVGGKVSVPHLLPYDASKFALTGLSEGLRAELDRFGVTVTTACPGLMRTGSPLNAFFKGKHRAEYTWFALGGNAPGLAMNGARAARRILDACAQGKAEVVLTPQAKALVWMNGLFPGLTQNLLGWVNRLLPNAGGIHSQRRRGRDSETALTRSPLTAFGRRAAAQNNELPTPS